MDTDLWLWLLSAAMSVAVGLRFFGHYYLQLLPPLCLITAGALVKRAEPIARGTVALALTAAAGFTIVGFVARPWADEPKYQRVSAYLERHLHESDRVFVWGHEPEIYWASGALPGTRFLSDGFVNGNWGGRPPGDRSSDVPTPGARQMLMSDLQVKRPRYILDTSPAAFRGSQYHPMKSIPELQRYVDRGYRYVRKIDDIAVYERRDVGRITAKAPHGADRAMSDPAPTRWSTGSRAGADDYDAQWKQLAARGVDPHGEVEFVMHHAPASVLDAGCGTGRVAIELARRGVDVAGVDLDAGLLGAARAKAPELSWHLADLTTVDLGRVFDVVVLAGNVMIFLAPGTEGAVLANLRRAPRARRPPDRRLPGAAPSPAARPLRRRGRGGGPGVRRALRRMGPRALRRTATTRSRSSSRPETAIFPLWVRRIRPHGHLACSTDDPRPSM